MTKKYSVFITALFCLFIFGFGIAQFIVPDRDFSEQENRFLSQFKAPTLSSLKSGEFMEDFEDYVVDQFPLRDRWIHLKAYCERFIGKKENNGAYLGADGQSLFAQFTAPSLEALTGKLAFVNKLGGNVSVPVHFALIPDKSFVWADRLPANAPLVDDGSTLQQAGQLCGENVHWIDLSGAISGGDAFYRTDHHWSTMGAYQGYLALVNAMGGSAVLPDCEPTQVSDSFYGTTYSSAGAGWVRPDEMYKWAEGKFTVTCYHSGRPEERDSLYFPENLEKKDKYTYFLGGNQPLCIIGNDNAPSGEKLLVIRDSYSDSLAPFLAQSYSEVHLWDLRYNRQSLKQYVAEQGIDRVLVLYSNANFSTDNNLFLLGL